MQHLGFFGVEVSTSRPSNSSWGSGSADANSRREQIAQVNDLPRHHLADYFCGNGGKPGPTMKGLFSTGNEVADKMLAWGNVAADETQSWDDVVAMLAMDSACEGFGGKKVNTKVRTTETGLPWAAEAPADMECAAQPAPEAAKAEACKESSEGTPHRTGQASGRRRLAWVWQGRRSWARYRSLFRRQSSLHSLHNCSQKLRRRLRGWIRGSRSIGKPRRRSIAWRHTDNIAGRRTIRIGFNLDEWRCLTILRRTRHDGKMLMKNANESAKIHSQKQWSQRSLASKAVRSLPLWTPKGRPHGSCANWARPLGALARDLPCLNYI